MRYDPLEDFDIIRDAGTPWRNAIDEIIKFAGSDDASDIETVKSKSKILKESAFVAHENERNSEFIRTAATRLREHGRIDLLAKGLYDALLRLWISHEGIDETVRDFNFARQLRHRSGTLAVTLLFLNAPEFEDFGISRKALARAVLLYESDPNNKSAAQEIGIAQKLLLQFMAKTKPAAPVEDSKACGGVKISDFVRSEGKTGLDKTRFDQWMRDNNELPASVGNAGKGPKAGKLYRRSDLEVAWGKYLKSHS